MNVFAQEFNTIVRDEKSGKPMLIGYTTLEAFNDTSFSRWWNAEYTMYDVDSSSAAELEEKIKDVRIIIVLGTWCSDSRREVPRLYKILDKIKYPVESVTLISVNRDKIGLENEVEGLQIDFVPTVIFSKDNKELGRIIEMPYDTLERDIMEILQK
jgi:hypothetical protein